MKNHVILIAAVAAAAAAAVSCTPKNEEPQDPFRVLNVDDVRWDEDPTTAGCKVYLAAPLPDDTTAAAAAVRQWMNQELGGAYEGDAADAQSMAQFYGNAKAEAVKADMAANGEDGSETDQYCDYTQFAKEFETALIVTFTKNEYRYMQGAHDDAALSGATFRKSDGLKLGWNMFSSEGLEKLRPLLCRTLMRRYFRIKNKDEFFDTLLVENADSVFPLPETEPFCRVNGVQFVYQQYEIAPYSAGMPQCTLPYSALDSLFAPMMKPLVESTADSLALTYKRNVR